MRRRRRTGVLGKGHAPDLDLDINLGSQGSRERPDAQRPADDGGFGEDFWEGQRPPHW